MLDQHSNEARHPQRLGGEENDGGTTDGGHETTSHDRVNSFWPKTNGILARQKVDDCQEYGNEADGQLRVYSIRRDEPPDQGQLCQGQLRHGARGHLPPPRENVGFAATETDNHHPRRIDELRVSQGLISNGLETRPRLPFTIRRIILVWLRSWPDSFGRELSRRPGQRMPGSSARALMPASSATWPPLWRSWAPREPTRRRSWPSG